MEGRSIYTQDIDLFIIGLLFDLKYGYVLFLVIGTFTNLTLIIILP